MPNLLYMFTMLADEGKLTFSNGVLQENEAQLK